MLPKSIERQGQLADQLQDKLTARNTEEAPAPAAPEQQAQATPEGQPNGQQEASSGDGWEDKYKVLSGKYNAEIPRFAAEIRALKGENTALKTQLSELQTQFESLKTQNTEVPSISEEDEARFGPELVDFVKRLTKSPGDSAKVQNLEQELRQVKEFSAETAKERFFTKLDGLAKNWTSLNTDASFLAWLTEYDPLLGRPRQEAFDEAFSVLDVERVAAFFNAFGGANGGRVDRPSIQDQVVPVSNAGVPMPATQQKRIWTQLMIRKFYEDMRRGRISDKDAAEIEADLAAAQQEGRVRV